MVASTLFPTWGQWNFFSLYLLLAVIRLWCLPFSLPKFFIQFFELFSTCCQTFLTSTPLFLLPPSSGSLNSLRQLRRHILGPSWCLRQPLVIILVSKWVSLVSLLDLKELKGRNLSDEDYPLLFFLRRSIRFYFTLNLFWGEKRTSNYFSQISCYSNSLLPVGHLSCFLNCISYSISC